MKYVLAGSYAEYRDWCIEAEQEDVHFLDMYQPKASAGLTIQQGDLVVLPGFPIQAVEFINMVVNPALVRGAK